MPPPLQKIVTHYPKRDRELNSPVPQNIPAFNLDPPVPNRVLCTENTPEAAITTSEFLCTDLITYGVLIKNVPCHTTVYVGAAVRRDAVEFVNAMADTYANSRAVGIAVYKPSATLCDVVISGKTGSIYVGLDVSKDYFLSPTVAGGLTTTVPTGSGHIVKMIGKPFSADELAVEITLSMQRS